MSQRPSRYYRLPVADRPLPAWPIDALLWGFPVWWLLGMTPFIVVLMAVIMAALMITRRGLGIVPGIVPWFGFVAWVFPCALMLDSALRLVGYAQRTSNYVALAIILLYVVNARERLTAARVVGGLTAVWVFVVFGGYLGTLFPEVRLTTPVGILLPTTITSNEYVADLVFPPFAEIQHPWGAPEPYYRPSAPFPYANGWGNAMALLTPVAFAQFVLTPSRNVKVALAGCLVAAALPAMMALNRGLFIGLGIAVTYVAVRLFFRGAVVAFIGLFTLGVVASTLLIAAGLLEELKKRAEFGSTEIRAEIYRETFARALESPLLGYGAPRPSQALYISVGTQGHFWMVMFSFGFVGLALFLWFLYGAVIRTWRAPRLPHLWLHSALVVSCALMLFYGLDTMQMLTVALIAALLLRDPSVTGRRQGSLSTEPARPTTAFARTRSGIR